MKKRFIIIIIAVALILFVPIPTGRYNDGGTKEYTALTYKIVKWHSLSGAEGEYYIKTRVYPFPLNFRSIDALWEREAANTASEDYYTEDLTAVVEDYVTVYYSAENGIESEEIFLPHTPEDLFSAWKAKNGIGDEVKLIKTEIKDNSTTESSEIGGSQVITHTVGDYFILNITVSKTIENYYSAYGEDLLKESLKKTMTGYTDIRYDEYYLYLE